MTTIDPDATGRKSAKRQRRKPTKSPHKTVPPSERGTAAYSIPQAGRMIGLSRGASYAAAKAGQIPTQQYGDRFIVPKAIWDRQLGVEN